MEWAPCRAWMPFIRETNAPIAPAQGTGRSAPVAGSRSSGVVARSGAASGVRASQPFGQAMPRFTG